VTARRLIVGFLAGALAVPICHQGALALLHAAGVAPQHAWAMPQLWSLTFWGGIWGVVLAALLGGLRGVALLGASLLFGALFPTLVAWFIVAPLKGQPIAAGFLPAAMLVGPIVNAAWGLGAGLGIMLFDRKERRRSTIDRRHVIQPVEHERRLVARREMALGGFPR
jgi:hypothetical protein